ncbi:MAG: carboxypeptidase regulatory-like domain-containing protein [Canidatus Methanoxibalbensis ujae]|nr:carboxypeptidase regulatory-like domain-containing protein [Candidatus Methanoxibalbensis ujae]
MNEKRLRILGILAFFVLFLALSSVAEAMNLSITAWSSSGGNPTNKDNPQDLIYKIQPGDTITFTVTTNETCNFTWKVMLGGKALQTYEENNTKTSSFTWQVPNETSTWDIVVECFKKEREIGTNPAVYLSWTITTSQIIEVSEDGDIQSAIDSLPDEGGVVELSAGTYNPNYTINITNRANITLRGAGTTTWNTELHYPDTSITSINIDNSENIRVEHLYINMTWTEDTLKRGIFIGGSSQSISVFKVRVEDTPFGFFTVDTPQYYIQILDCVFYHNKRAIFPMEDEYITIKSTKVYHSWGWSGIDFNSGNHHALVENCYFYDCDVGSVKIYSGSGDVTVKNCVINHSKRFGGAYISGSDNKGPSKVLNCIIKNGYAGSNGVLINGIYGNNGTIIKNNIIYNNEGCGIKTTKERYNYSETWYIESNVIYGNGEGGICNPALENKNIIVKNNIIANNNGYGLTNSISSSKIISSYNNIYNNSLGMYNGTVTNKTGDISVNPLFADPENGDFHLKSQYGRWNGTDWVKDNVTSPCIDAGDPADDYSNEPDYPNGKINMGAYGNTGEASLGTSPATGTLKGKVTDKNTNLPIEEAIITANFYRTTTNSTGDYILSLPVGNYTITASKDGYYPSTATAEILENQTTTLNFTLITPPIISNIMVTNITQTSATIEWKTDEPSTSLIKYGTSPGSYPYFKEDTSYTTTHSLTLTNLQPNTSYYFVVNSTDRVGNSAESSEYSFKTKEPDTTAPVISNITVSAVTGSTATITWKTDEPATSQIEYGLTTSYGSSTPLDTNLVTEHTQTITGLKSNTTYHFRVKSKDASNNEAVSEDNTFTTGEEANLVAYYKLDEGSGTTAYDSSENGNDGTIYGGATWVDGKIGKALSFDGSNDYVDLPDNIITAPSLRSNGSTLIAWVKVEPSLTGRKGIVGTAACTSGWSVFGLDYYNGKARLETYDSGADHYQRVESTTNINDGKWHHIAGTYDPSDKKMRIYVDGVLEGTSSEISRAGWSTGSNYNYIGKNPISGDYFFNGTIDEVKIYNRALSAEEILADYQGEVSHIVYVATDGSGDYNCDGKDDQIEINQAIAYINSIGGGTVHLKAGTYIISDSINLSSNLIFEGEGTENTTIKIEDGSTKENWATIAGDGISSTVIRNLTIDGNKENCPVPKGINSDVDAIDLYNSDNLTVENVKMIDFWTDGVMFVHSINSVVKDCEVIQAGHEGLRAIYSDNITFSNNYVYSAGTGNAGIRIYESSNCIIENNYFNVYGFGILINPQGGVSCGNNIYRDNYIEGHYGLPGIALWPWDTEISNETLIRNIIARTDGTQEPYGHGIHLRTRGTASLKNIKIINNVINNALKSGIYVEDRADVSNIVAKNNIIVNNGEYGIYGNVLSSYNDVWNNNAGNYGGGASAGKGDISADPLFASPPHDFHLKSQAGRWNGSAPRVKDNVTSPCIDAGVPSEEDPVYGDYRNEPPPNGSRINMGAYGNTREASMSVEIEENTYSISGYVKYENGTGIFNAHVTDNRTGAEDYTDKKGYYVLHGLTNGTYLITASAGSLSNSIVVTIAGRDVENANITLAEDTSPPSIFFTSPTTDHTTENWVYVNVTVIDESPTSSFINWNNTLAAYWSFNSVNETKWTPDFSEHHNHGLLGDGNTAEMPVLTEGKFGPALKFDGVNDFIRVPDAPSLDGFSDGEITIEAWIKPVLGSRGSIVNKYLYDRTIPINERVYELDVESDGRIDFALSSNGTYAGTVWLASEMKVKNNTWTHIAAVSDGKTMKIFINGVQDANTAQAPPRIHDSPYSLYIGRWQWSPTDWDYPFKGVIDELRIWNRALSPEEINASFASGALRHNFTDLKDGRYAYYAYATDTAGNYNRTETRYITVNTVGEPPQIISFSPSDLTPTQYVNHTYTFSVTVSQPVSNAWFLDGEDQNNNAQSWTHTWSASEEGVHNVTYLGMNENGSVSVKWTVEVKKKNNPPYISPLENQTGFVGVPWSYDISAFVYDPDGDPLTVTTDDELNITVDGFVLHFLYSAPVYEKRVNVTITDSGGLSATEDFFVTVTEGNVLYVRDTSAPPGTVSIPVYISCNISTVGIGFKLSYNSSVLSLLTVQKGALLTDSWCDPEKGGEEGAYKIGIVGPESDSIENGTSGPVIVLNFDVIGKPGDRTPLNISDVTFVFVDGKKYTEIKGTSRNATFSVENGDFSNYVRGTVVYACNNTPISDAFVCLKGDDYEDSTYTDENGIFIISIPPGNYTLTASKERFMENSTVIHMGDEEVVIIDMMLYIKGDLNNDGNASQIGDVQMMWSAWKGEETSLPDYVYDLNGDGDPADLADVAMIWNAWKGEIVL